MTDRTDILRTLQQAAPSLSPLAAEVLSDAYCATHLQGTEFPEPVLLDTGPRIPIEQGAEIHRLIRESGARRALEIGFAYGFSTVWLIDALAGAPGGSHIAVDPLERSMWDGVGLHQAARLAPLGCTFTHIEEPGILALADLIREGRRFDFIFIDGNHRFDDVIVDFYLADKLLGPGGMVAFDDTWLPSIKDAVRFVERNRDYAPVPVHRRPDIMAVFRKEAEDERPWDHYVEFLAP